MLKNIVLFLTKAAMETQLASSLTDIFMNSAIAAIVQRTEKNEQQQPQGQLIRVGRASQTRTQGDKNCTPQIFWLEYFSASR